MLDAANDLRDLAAVPGSRLQFEQRIPAFWKIAAGLYGTGGNPAPDKGAVKRLYYACPPFRAMNLALWVQIYDRCIRGQGPGQSLRAGRMDTFSAIYLPYAHVFITTDDGQLTCFQKVKEITGSTVELRSSLDPA